MANFKCSIFHTAGKLKLKIGLILNAIKKYKDVFSLSNCYFGIIKTCKSIEITVELSNKLSQWIKKKQKTITRRVHSVWETTGLLRDGGYKKECGHSEQLSVVAVLLMNFLKY